MVDMMLVLARSMQKEAKGNGTDVSMVEDPVVLENIKLEQAVSF